MCASRGQARARDAARGTREREERGRGRAEGRAIAQPRAPPRRASVSRDGRADVDAWAGRGRSFARPDIRLAPSETAWKNRSNAKIPIKQPALPSVDRESEPTPPITRTDRNRSTNGDARDGRVCRQDDRGFTCAGSRARATAERAGAGEGQSGNALGIATRASLGEKRRFSRRAGPAHGGDKRL
jgi:hypothetical protein